MAKIPTIDTKSIPPSEISEDQIRELLRQAIADGDKMTEALCNIALDQDTNDRTGLTGEQIAELASHDHDTARAELMNSIDRPTG